MTRGAGGAGQVQVYHPEGEGPFGMLRPLNWRPPCPFACDPVPAVTLAEGIILVCSAVRNLRNDRPKAGFQGGPGKDPSGAWVRSQPSPSQKLWQGWRLAANLATSTDSIRFYFIRVC
jgi:hypothetical protein